MTHPVGGVCWIDLGVPAVEAAVSFYSGLFGWTIADPDETGYRLAGLRGHLVAALGPAEDPQPPYWTIYVHTADILASTGAAVDAGGTVVVPPTPAGDAGVSAIVHGPDGDQVSLWQPGRHTGTHANGEHGTFAGVRLEPSEFLLTTLNWRKEPDGTITHAGRTVATWGPRLVYFVVTDVAAAIERAVRLGASHAEADVLIDPAGARFGVTRGFWPAVR
jgi:predicted enzyme related to lactoylglutathione lyase